MRLEMLQLVFSSKDENQVRVICSKRSRWRL